MSLKSTHLLRWIAVLALAAGPPLAAAISGSRVAVGAPNVEIGDDLARGAAYVFARPPGGWVSATETTRLTASGGEEGDFLGFSVAVTGTTVLAGAPVAELVEGGPDPGSSVRVFETAPAIVEIPALTSFGLLALALGLSGIALRALRRRMNA